MRGEMEWKEEMKLEQLYLYIDKLYAMYTVVYCYRFRHFNCGLVYGHSSIAFWDLPSFFF